MKTTIKQHRNKNRYYLTETGLWVRDFTRPSAAQDINHLTDKDDYEVMLVNEMKNASLNVASIDTESVYAPNVVIVSDGYDFETKKKILAKLPANKVTVIGTNRSLVKWTDMGATRMDWFVANNPYKECMNCLPQHNYYPRCVVSNRTYPDFISRYRARLGVVYRYSPVVDDKFSTNYFPRPLYYVDDYRNSICAALALAFRWEAQKILLFCCDDSFDGERPGSEKLDNGLWMYPQHHVSHGLIDGAAYWITTQDNVKVKIANHSAGPEYKHIEYIREDELLKFFD